MEKCYNISMNEFFHNTPALKKKLKTRVLAEYISGYVDGEGCFSVSFTKRTKFLVGWETKPSFSISQNHYVEEGNIQSKMLLASLNFR
jgi:hypothetical protein